MKRADFWDCTAVNERVSRIILLRTCQHINIDDFTLTKLTLLFTVYLINVVI